MPKRMMFGAACKLMTVQGRDDAQRSCGLEEGATMNHLLQMTSLAAFIAATTLSAFAQAPVTYRATCQGIGMAPQENVGDREGHTYSFGQYSCQIQGGPFDGAILTGSTVWESEKGSSILLAGNGAIRKPGMSAIYVLTDGKNSATVVDGKVTGFSGTAKGVYKIAAGTASSLAGKSYRFHIPNHRRRAVCDRDDRRLDLGAIPRRRAYPIAGLVPTRTSWQNAWRSSSRATGLPWNYRVCACLNAGVRRGAP